MTRPGRTLPLARGALVALATLVVAAAPRVRAQDDDPPIEITEEGPIPTEGAPADGGEKKPAASDDDDDDIIIIEEDDEDAQQKRPPAVSGALGRLWETWHVAADSDLIATLQLAQPEDGPGRLLGSVWLESWLLPAPNLSFYANGFGRAAIDATPSGRLVPIADLYEAFAKINVDRAVVNIGRIVVPWGRTQAAALGDRVNPPDLRRGPPFPDPARQKQPMWGASVRTSVGSLGIEGVAFAQYENVEGSLAAANQGGVRIARYQSALVRSPARVGGLLDDDDTSSLREPPSFASTASLAGRAWRRIGDLDVSGSVVWGFDETPKLRLRPDVARALAGELFALRPGFVDEGVSCGDEITIECVGGQGTLENGRTTSFSLDASWGLGVVIVRAEMVAYPRVGSLGGKTALVVDDLGLRSLQVSQYGGALAVEGSIGESVDGSLELFDVIWDQLPANALLWGVEPFSDDVTADRVVHRVAAAASLGGAVFGERLHWRVRGEAGLVTPDVLVSAEARYTLPVLNLYVGGRTDLFTGFAGTPGWFRQDASLVGVFIGEGG
jgi:hypothetical protein